MLELVKKIKKWGQELGFAEIRITDCDLEPYKQHFLDWLKKDYHGQMQYMTKHGNKRINPKELVPGTLKIIMARMNYMPPTTKYAKILTQPKLAAISRYALGADYHKFIRKRLQKLAAKISAEVSSPFNYRVFTDSGPVLEKALAAKAGLGWYGKNSLILNKKDGSYFFLGTIYTDLDLPIDNEVSAHCGTCSACITKCPTGAIVAPYTVDARKCISYLTIEYKGSIPIELRTKMGNRIFGCDDCQMVCPWNKFSKVTTESKFFPRHNLDNATLQELFLWSEEEFQAKTQGSAIKRAGYFGWLRNIAIALGNAPYSLNIINTLKQRQNHANPIVKEHVQWAIKHCTNKAKV